MGRVSLLALAVVIFTTGVAVAAPGGNSSVSIAVDGGTFRLQLGGPWNDLPDEAKRVVLEQIKDALPPAKLKQVLSALVAGKQEIEVALDGAPAPATKVEAERIVLKKGACSKACGGKCEEPCGDVDIELLAEGDVVVERLEGESPKGTRKRAMVVLRGGDADDIPPEILEKIVEHAKSATGVGKPCGGRCETCGKHAKGHAPEPPHAPAFRNERMHGDPLLRAVEALCREIQGLRRDIRAQHGGGCPKCQAKAPAKPESRRIMLRTTPGKAPPQVVGLAPGGAIAIERAPASKEVAELKKQLAETQALIRALMKRIAALEEKSR